MTRGSFVGWPIKISQNKRKQNSSCKLKFLFATSLNMITYRDETFVITILEFYIAKSNCDAAFDHRQAVIL